MAERIAFDTREYQSAHGRKPAGWEAKKRLRAKLPKGRGRIEAVLP
jgi:hypothetical protein